MPDNIIQSQPIEEEEEELMPKIQMQEEEEELIQTKPIIQLQPVEEEEELLPKLQMQEEEELLQAQPIQTLSRDNSPEWIQRNIISSKGMGSPLPPNTLSFMEKRFGVDFSDVNIHTGSTAVQMNRSLGAHAFTTGKDIYFNNGKFNPESSSGRHLLAHELTHVIQQGKAKFIQRQDEKPEWKKDEKIFKAVVLSLDPKKPKSNSDKFKESIEKTLGTLGKKKMRDSLFNKLKLSSKGQQLLSVVGISGYSLYSLGKGKIPALKYDFKIKDNTWLTVSTGGEFVSVDSGAAPASNSRHCSRHSRSIISGSR